MSGYVPSAGDIISLDFDPQSGHEQKGRRPAVVLSNATFNRGTRLAIVCPITSRDRGFPFHLPLPEGGEITRFAMMEQVKSIDYRTRRAKCIEKAPDDFMEEAHALLAACF